MKRSSIEFERGGVATLVLLPTMGGPERRYRLDVFQGDRRVSLLCGREELRRFAALLAAYTAGTPPAGVPETGP